VSPETRLLAAALDAADRLAEDLRLSRADLDGKAPFAPEALAAMDRTTQKDTLAFLKTFEQLQDVLANRLVRAILAETGTDTSGWSVRDAFNRMEALGALPDAGRALEIAKLRNRLVHEYPMSAARRAERINAAWAMAPALLEDAETLAAYAGRLTTEGDAP
jgi:hypothetical protein